MFMGTMFTQPENMSRQVANVIKTEGSKLSRFQLPEISKDYTRGRIPTDASMVLPTTPVEFSKTLRVGKPLGFQMD